MKTSVIGLMRPWALVCAALGALSFPAAVLAQGLPAPTSSPAATSAPSAAAETATIRGTTTDENGVPLGGVVVTLSGPFRLSATSDARGAYLFASVPPGMYTLTARHAGFETATHQEYAILAGTAATLDVTLAPGGAATGLHEIGRVTRRGAGSQFNTTSAAVQSISTQTIIDRGQLQTGRILDQTPGVFTFHSPRNSNGGTFGSSSTPIVRGTRPFETADLIDGHPLIGNTYGFFNATFLNAYTLGDVDVVKGPGAGSMLSNRAIGGAVNFRTKMPTTRPEGDLTLGFDSFGGQFSHAGTTGTLPNGKLGYVFDYSVFGSPGPYNPTQQFMPLSAFNGGTSDFTFAIATPILVNGVPTSTTDTTTLINGVQNAPDRTYSLVGCCVRRYSIYQNKAELVKLRYAFNDRTSLLVSAMGGQALSDQNASEASFVTSLFAPGPGYTNSLLPGNSTIDLAGKLYLPELNPVINQQNLYQADFTTMIKRDTLVARYWSAQLKTVENFGTDTQGANNPPSLAQNPWCQDPFTNTYAPASCLTMNVNVYGTMVPGDGNFNAVPGAQPVVYNGQSVPVTFFSVYDHNYANDKFGGYTLSYTHHAGPNAYTASIDQYANASVSYNHWGPHPQYDAYPVPSGTKAGYTTALLRAELALTPHLSATLANYLNLYRYHTSQNQGATFTDTSSAHDDARLAFAWRPTSDVSWRVSAGSAIAPPYLAQMTIPTSIPRDTGRGYATQTISSAGLHPETSFGYDLGADVRSRDGYTVFSADAYWTHLQNQIFSSTRLVNGPVLAIPVKSPPNAAPTSLVNAVVQSSNFNLGNSIYKGLELSLRRDVPHGFGFTMQGALTRAYPYAIPAGIWSTTNDPNAKTKNLEIIPDANFQSGGYPGFTPAGRFYSNSGPGAVPYAMGYASAQYRTLAGGLASLGLTFYGKNNTYAEPPFFVADATLRLPLAAHTTLQISGDNLFDAFGGRSLNHLYAGVPITLANGNTEYTNANVVTPPVVRFSITRHLGGP